MAQQHDAVGTGTRFTVGEEAAELRRRAEQPQQLRREWRTPRTAAVRARPLEGESAVGGDLLERPRGSLHALDLAPAQIHGPSRHPSRLSAEAHDAYRRPETAADGAARRGRCRTSPCWRRFRARGRRPRWPRSPGFDRSRGRRAASLAPGRRASARPGHCACVRESPLRSPTSARRPLAPLVCHSAWSTGRGSTVATRRAGTTDAGTAPGQQPAGPRQESDPDPAGCARRAVAARRGSGSSRAGREGGGSTSPRHEAPRVVVEAKPSPASGLMISGTDSRTHVASSLRWRPVGSSMM